MNTASNIGFLELRRWLVDHVARATSQAPESVDPARRFVQLGLDSVMTMGMVAALSGKLGRDLPATLVWDHPTPIALAAHLTNAPASATPVAGAGGKARAKERGARSASSGLAPLGIGEPIAVVGLAGRFPGASTAEELWARVRAGEDLVGELSELRRRAEGHGETGNVRQGGFLNRVDEFDPGFFGITRAEALHMDPQQRLLLELAWELLQDAGTNPTSLHGSPTGVFVGAMWNDYARMPRGGLEHIRQQTALGFDLSGLSARISYGFGLHGPSLTVNTACSSSLVAIHLACGAIARGEAEQAIAGGVNLIIGPESTSLMTKFGAMAPDARCKAFDARANGYVRGEGAGLVLLMPLSAALRGGHHIYCLIRGSAVNNDGASNGITAPNPGAQVDVLRQAYENAGVEPNSVDYVEAHGTGTLLGDPIEARALAAALCTDRDAEHPLRIGSLKTNIGHLESAAGVAGFIKVAMSLDRRRLLPTRNFEQPNPHIPFAELRLRVQTSDEPWPVVAGRPPRAGISGFGFGGTNCHVVLEGFEDDARLIEIRGKDRASIAAELGRRLQGGKASLDAVAGAEPGNRGGERATLAVAARHLTELELLCERLGAGDASAEALIGGGERAEAPLVLVFPGQGGQWLGMARGLLRAAPAFRAEFMRCRDLLREYASWDLMQEVLGSSDARFDDIAFVQPALFAYQVSVVAQLRAEGFHPDIVIGHSMGEVAAAYVAGLLSLEDATKVIARRSALMAGAPGDGAMLCIDMSAQEAESIIARSPGVGISVVNGARSVVLSGERALLEELVQREFGSGTHASRRPPRFVNVRVASHSPQMDAVLPALVSDLADLKPAPGVLPMVSTVLGRPLDVPADAGYWRDNLRRPVQFQRALAHVLARHPRATLLEISPHPVLRDVMSEAQSGDAGPLLAHVGRRGEPETATLYENLALLARHGARGHAPPAAPKRPVLVAVSAHEEAALGPALSTLERELHRMGPLEDIAHTLDVRSAHQRHRVALVVDSKAALQAELAAAAAGSRSIVRGKRGARAPQCVFVYSGQGSQWAGMGVELSRAVPEFRRDYESTLAKISQHLGVDLLAAVSVSTAESNIDATFYAQPAIFAFQVALTRLLHSFGIAPEAVVGHSVGEIAAAWASGALELDDACRLVAVRADVLRRSTGTGKMLSVRASVGELERMIAEEGLEGQLDIAAINSPRDVVLAGANDAIERAAARLRARGFRAVEPRVTSPFHSRWLGDADSEIAARCADIQPRPPVIPWMSTVDTELVSRDGVVPSYWGRNVREPVRFTRAIERMAEHGYEYFVEIGAHPVLGTALSEILGGHASNKSGKVLAACNRKQPVVGPFAAAASLYAAGMDLKWENVLLFEGRVVPMPAPAWQRESLWLAPAAPAVPTAASPKLEKDKKHDLPRGFSQASTLALPEPAHLFVVSLAEAPRRGRGELDVVALGRQAALWLGDDVDECQWNSPAIDSEAIAASGAQLQLMVQPEDSGYRILLSSLTTGRTPRESKTRVLGQGNLRRRLRSAPRWVAELDWSLLSRSKLLDEVQCIVASIVESPVEKLDFQRSFFDLGMDSVMIVRLAEQITLKSGMTLNAATIFDYEDASRLTNYLVQKLRAANQPNQERLAG